MLLPYLKMSIACLTVRVWPTPTWFMMSLRWRGRAARCPSGGVTPSTSAPSRSCSPSCQPPSQVPLFHSRSLTNYRNVQTCPPFFWTDVLMLMTSGLEAEPLSHVSTQDDDTLTPGKQSQAESPSGSAGGPGLGPAFEMRRSSSGGPLDSTSPVVSPSLEEPRGPARPTDALPSDGWDSRMLESQPGTPGSCQSTAGIPTLTFVSD